VTTADKRERLEAQVWRSWPRATRIHVDAILGAADMYADARAEEKIARMTPEQWRARLRLAEAAAEADGRTT
jgi:hypothetical protein